MPAEQTIVQPVTAVGHSVEIDTRGASAVLVAVAGTGTMTLEGEASYDKGVTWVPIVGVRLGPSITAPGVSFSCLAGYTVSWPTQAAPLFRVRVSAVIVAGTLNLQVISTLDAIPTTAVTLPGASTRLGVVGVGDPPTVSITNGAALDDGTARDALGCSANWTLTAVGGAGVNGGVVTLELSNDNANWIGQGTLTMGVGVQALHVTGKPFRHGRARISTAITGGTVTCQVASAG